MTAEDILVTHSAFDIGRSHCCFFHSNDQRDCCVKDWLLSLWPIQSCLFLAEIVNKGPIDKDGTFNNAEKPAETGKVLKLA